MLYVESNVGVEIKDTNRMMKKEARHASPLVLVMEAAPMLRFPCMLCYLLSDPLVIL
jgi:hypothetical protein